MGTDELAVVKLRGAAAKSKPRLQPDDSAGLAGPRACLEVAECQEGIRRRTKGTSKLYALNVLIAGLGPSGDLKIDARS